jgi:hypothetical protein
MTLNHFVWEWGLAYALINASGGVTKLVVRVSGKDAESIEHDTPRVWAIEDANKKLGTVGKLESVNHVGYEEIWFWEREDGKSFATPVRALD